MNEANDFSLALKVQGKWNEVFYLIFDGFAFQILIYFMLMN